VRLRPIIPMYAATFDTAQRTLACLPCGRASRSTTKKCKVVAGAGLDLPDDSSKLCKFPVAHREASRLANRFRSSMMPLANPGPSVAAFAKRDGNVPAPKMYSPGCAKSGSTKTRGAAAKQAVVVVGLFVQLKVILARRLACITIFRGRPRLRLRACLRQSPTQSNRPR